MEYAKTKQLMVKFYTELKAGKRKDDALRTAILSVMKDGDPKHASPYFWAALELIGDAAPLPK